MRLTVLCFLLKTTIDLMFPSHLSTSIAKKSRTRLFISGDILLGALIPVHFSPNFAPHPGNTSCRGAFHIRGFKGVEAILYAVELINNDSNLLPNVRLGVDIKDTCGSIDYAIMESLSFDFIKSAFAENAFTGCAESREDVLTREANHHRVAQKLNDSASELSNSRSSTRENINASECCFNKTRTAAIIGAAFSGVTMATASLIGLFHVPVISFASTSRLLSDRTRFQYFYRTVPSDSLQAQAVTGLLHRLRWHFVIALASDNEYGRSGIAALKQTINNQELHRICIVVDQLFSRKGSKEEMKNIFEKIRQFSQARVIILYAEFPDAVYFFKEAKKAFLRDYLFFASDSWAGSLEVIQGAEDVFHSIIGLRPPIINVTGFDSFFVDRLRRNDTENPWAADFNKSLICEDDTVNHCDTDVHHDGYVPYVMDAVFSVAHALHAMLNCSKTACKKKWHNIDPKNLSEYIRRVNLSGFSQSRIFFDKEGSTRGQYDIYFLRNRSSKYVKVRTWKNGTPILNFELFKASENDSFDIPVSLCSKDCKKGEYKIPKSQFPECCWDCAKCDGKSFTNTSNMTNCADCPEGTWPTTDHSDCRPIEAKYLHWSEAWAFAIISLSLFGFSLVVGTCLLFVKSRGTAIVRAASRQLCHVHLLGIALFYVTPLCYIIKPSESSCKLLPFMFGMSFVLVVGTILIKTNRVSRIFNEKLLRTGTISCLSNYWQLCILGCLLTTELVLSIAWVFGPSTSPFKEVIHSESSKDASLVCNLNGSKIGFALWLIYNAGLVIVCTYQAFLVRKVPQNYNESRLIAFNMTTMCITILVYIPSYMGATAWYRAVISSLMFIFLGILTWASIFAPKIYIILLRPHKNIPMRPSVTSITLGVITPSPTVVSGSSEQGMPSGQNSLSPDESLEDIWATFEPSRDTSNDRLESDSKCSERENNGNTEFDYVQAGKFDSIKTTKNFEMTGQKKTSVVHFEDSLNTENIQFNDEQIIRRKTSSTQGGILRKSNTSENFEDSNNGLTAKKKKTSLVRFQDEIANYNKVNGPDCNAFNFPAKNGEPDQVSVDGINLEETVNDTIPRCFPVPKFNSNKRDTPNGFSEQGRKRKISVFAFQ